MVGTKKVNGRSCGQDTHKTKKKNNNKILKIKAGSLLILWLTMHDERIWDL